MILVAHGDAGQCKLSEKTGDHVVGHIVDQTPSHDPAEDNGHGCSSRAMTLLSCRPFISRLLPVPVTNLFLPLTFG